MFNATSTGYLVTASGSTSTLLTVSSGVSDLSYVVILLMVVCALLGIDLVRRLFIRN